MQKYKFNLKNAKKPTINLYDYKNMTILAHGL